MKELESDKYNKQCVFNDHGYRCQNDGHLSSTTYGEGPWYCRQHFCKVMGWPDYTVPQEQMAQADVDARGNKRLPRNPNESEHDWSMRCRDATILILSQLKAMVAK